MVATRLFATCLLAAIATAAPLEKRATVLADGSSMKSGKISGQLSWQSSGRLVAGSCPNGVGISSCYQVLLGSSGNIAKRSGGDDSETDKLTIGHADVYDPESTPFGNSEGNPEWEEAPSPISNDDGNVSDVSANSLVKRGSARQRIELYSTPFAGSGTSWTFQWKSYLTGSGFKTTDSWIHLFQLLSRGGGRTGPIITLDARSGKVMVTDPARCKNCASMPISSFTGRTIKHTLTVKFGTNGKLKYTASNASTGQRLLSYEASGEMGSEASLKAGAYREVVSGMTALKSYVGDFSFKRNY